jgi:Flp pilus assembly pilin Flp
MGEIKRLLRHATSVTGIGYGLIAAVIVLVLINLASRP